MMVLEPETKAVSRVRASGSPRKIPLRFLAAVLVTGFLLTVVAMRWQSTRKISRIVVNGAALIPAQEIVDMVNITEDSLTINEMSFSVIESRVKLHPFVKTVSAFRSSGDAIVLKVQERTPIAHVLYRGKQSYLDADGTRLPYRLVGSVLDVPMIAFVGKSVMDSVALHDAITILQTLNTRDKELASSVSEVQVRANGEFALVLTTGATPALLGKIDHLDDKIVRLGLFWRQFSAQLQQRAFASVDVRWSGQVVTRPAP
jgi:cell division protein FtsQ